MSISILSPNRDVLTVLDARRWTSAGISCTRRSMLRAVPLVIHTEYPNDTGFQGGYLEDTTMHHRLFCEVCIVCPCILSNVYIT